MIKLEGRYELELRRGGKVIHRESGKNLITSAGEALTALYHTQPSASAELRYMALGSDDTFPLKSDTTLNTEIAGTRTDNTANTTTANVVTFWFQHTAAGTFTVKEVGIFNDIAAGTMMSRFLTQTFEMNTGDILNVTWSLEFTGVEE